MSFKYIGVSTTLGSSVFTHNSVNKASLKTLSLNFIVKYSKNNNVNRPRGNIFKCPRKHQQLGKGYTENHHTFLY